MIYVYSCVSSARERTGRETDREERLVLLLSLRTSYVDKKPTTLYPVLISEASVLVSVTGFTSSVGEKKGEGGDVRRWKRCTRMSNRRLGLSPFDR